MPASVVAAGVSAVSVSVSENWDTEMRSVLQCSSQHFSFSLHVRSALHQVIQMITDTSGREQWKDIVNPESVSTMDSSQLLFHNTLQSDLGDESCPCLTFAIVTGVLEYVMDFTS